MKSLYLIGSLRNEEVPRTAKELRSIGLDVFDDWYAAGPEADDYWQKYELSKGNSYSDALNGYAAKHVFEFDRHHLDRCDSVLLLLPAGRSGHLELGYAVGRGKEGYILLDQDYQTEGRFDVMYSFATKVFENKEQMIEFFDSKRRAASGGEVYPEDTAWVDDYHPVSKAVGYVRDWSL